MNSTIDSSHERRASGIHSASLLFGALIALLASLARSDGPAPPTRPEDSWQKAERMTPEELVQTLRSPDAAKPAMFNVGFRVLFTQAHIPGSQYTGPGSNPTGLDSLRKAVSALPKTKEIVLYCGCCPWERCPNLEQPWKMLRSAGFTRVKVLFIPKNFGQAWVQKGYPVEAGDPNRG